MNYVSDYYGLGCQQFGGKGWAASSWSSADMQARCFENLLHGLGKHMEGTVLDVGCGQGDFYPVLMRERPDMLYQGVDLCPEMVKYARLKYPGINVHIQDFMKEYYRPKADHVVASGTFNINIPDVDMEDLIRKALAKMFDCCTRSVVVDITCSGKKSDTDEIFYYDGVELLKYALTLTNFVGFSQMPKHYGMVLYLYKEEYAI